MGVFRLEEVGLSRHIYIYTMSHEKISSVVDYCLWSGVPTRLSGHASMVLTHKLRALHHAILVGVGTVLADDPSLTVRLVPGTNPQPVILDTHLRCPLDSKLLTSSRCKRPIIITTDFSLRGCSRRGDDWVSNEALKKKERRCRLESAGAKVWTCKSTASGRIDLQAALGSVYSPLPAFHS
jgi:3,4-dihydroxy 2-butanone 4-phosphate synthase/GTP cyclohydrolase II